MAEHTFKIEPALTVKGRSGMDLRMFATDLASALLDDGRKVRIMIDGLKLLVDFETEDGIASRFEVELIEPVLKALLDRQEAMDSVTTVVKAVEKEVRARDGHLSSVAVREALAELEEQDNG